MSRRQHAARSNVCTPASVTSSAIPRQHWPLNFEFGPVGVGWGVKLRRALRRVPSARQPGARAGCCVPGQAAPSRRPSSRAQAVPARSSKSCREDLPRPGNDVASERVRTVEHDNVTPRGSRRTLRIDHRAPSRQAVLWREQPHNVDRIAILTVQQSQGGSPTWSVVLRAANVVSPSGAALVPGGPVARRPRRAESRARGRRSHASQRVDPVVGKLAQLLELRRCQRSAAPRRSLRCGTSRAWRCIAAGAIGNLRARLTV